MVFSPSDPVAARGLPTQRADYDEPVMTSPHSLPPALNSGGPKGRQPTRERRAPSRSATAIGATWPSPARPTGRVDMPDDRSFQAVTPPGGPRTKPPAEASRRRFIAATAAASGAAVVGGLVAGSPAQAAETAPGSRVSTAVAGVQEAGPKQPTPGPTTRPGGGSKHHPHTPEVKMRIV